MTCSKNILLIEDDVGHQNSIKTKLTEAGFQVDILTSNNDFEILNFTVKKEYFVVIVDEALSGPLGLSGFDLIMTKLWPMDSAMRFIHFSGAPTNTLHSSSVSLPAIKPLLKERTPSDASLKDECLQQLLDTTKAYYDRQVPSFRIPDYEATHQWLYSELQRSMLPVHVEKAVADSMRLASEKLSKFTTFASTFCRLGTKSEDITLGVFGSYGRFEPRTDSDIEMCVLSIEDINNDAVFSAAVSTWNRAYRFCTQELHLQVEGELEPGILLDSALAKRRAAPELLNFPTDNYAPVYSCKSLFESKEQHRHAHSYNRLYQVLTEMQPVLNPDLLNAIKRRMLMDTSPDGEIMDVKQVLLSLHVKEMCHSALTHIQANKVDDLNKRFKTFLFRTVGLLSFRILLIYIAHKHARMNSKSEISQMLQLLTLPVILKLQIVRENYSDIAELNDALSSLISTCGNAFFRFSNHEIKTEDDLEYFISEVWVTFEKAFRVLQTTIGGGMGHTHKWVFELDHRDFILRR